MNETMTKTDPIEPAASVPALATAARAGTVVARLELVAIFAAGFLVMSYIYGGLVSDRGLPGNDSFYHLKMAAMLPDVGLVKEFPWLDHAYFMRQGDGFVSHHYGFHAVLQGFIEVGSWFGIDEQSAGRIAMATFMGLNLLVGYAILASLNVRWRGVWLLVFLLLPFQFFLRHAYVRAIGPSTFMMLLITLFVIRRQYWLTAAALGIFVHMYLGGVMYGPLIIFTFVVAAVFSPKSERVWPTRLIVFAVVGWLVGIMTFPYREGMVEFLQLQVFGTGLSPDIPVGREWKPYQDLWWFASSFAGTLLGIHVVILVARFRFGPRLSATETALLFLNLGFFLLTLKARRFIEYWPIYCLICSAVLASPLIAAAQRQVEQWSSERHTTFLAWLRRGLIMIGVLGGVLLTYKYRGEVAVIPAAVWVVLVVLGFRVWSRVRTSPSLRDGLMALPLTACVLALAIPVSGVAGVSNLDRASNAVRCKYNLPAITELMEHAKLISEPGDVIFTDDWDVFPVFFYHNTHNRYIVGLDPKFTHERRPDLWERFVRITQARVPGSRRIRMTHHDGTAEWKTIRTQLSDIRTVFNAKLVITDRNHEGMARKLAKAPELAELVYPLETQSDRPRLPYKLWRILDAGTDEQPLDDSLPIESNGLLYLSLLPPAPATGDAFMVDQSFGGRTIRIGRRQHLRGLVTLPGTTVSFMIPEGFSYFEVTLGVDGERSKGLDLQAEIRVDGMVVEKLDTFTENGNRIRVPVSAGTQLELVTTGESNGSESGLAWASARLAP
jgi:hypothetical protein